MCAIVQHARVQWKWQPDRQHPLKTVLDGAVQWVFGLADTSSKPAITYMEMRMFVNALSPVVPHLSLHILSSR
jgi:hypothetical protein